MSSKNLIGSYVLDTLQIYFAWDDDLYTHFKERGLGQSGMLRKQLPLIYTDNCESTTGVPERKRKYVIAPEFFGETCEKLGWKAEKQKTQPVIPAEKPEVKISLINDGEDLEFRICPRVDGKEQYHLEYSSRFNFGVRYKNWSVIYLTMDDFLSLISRLATHFPKTSSGFKDIPIHVEEKQEQRERLVYVKVPVKSYKYSMGDFRYMRQYFKLNGVDGKLPALVFKDEPSYRQIMDPLLLLGIVHTKEEHGFEARKPQCAMKITQPKTTISKRGKKARVKGEITISETDENYFVVPAKKFAILAQTLNQRAPAFFK
jgi:hypothetical protein